ncbi:MAG: hypothetical protein DUD31_08140 [Coriobacteriaceae bacterium]|nr:MAG: hypothetical protein DUD31_08140 [Coriobacteriaceae bacterium]
MYQEAGIWQSRNAGAAAGLPDSAICIGKQAMPAWERAFLKSSRLFTCRIVSAVQLLPFQAERLPVPSRYAQAGADRVPIASGFELWMVNR